MQKERINWIDITKGVGIIFIIYGHMLGSNDFRYLLYAFHIPLFFFLSGIVYKKYDGLKTVIKKSIRGLLVPYFIFAFISFPLWLVRLNPSVNVFTEGIKQFLSIFYANSNNGLMAFNNILWFLPTLFITRILFAIFNKYFNNAYFLLFILLNFSAIGYFFSIIAPQVKLPLGIETAISAIVFYGAGYLWNTNETFKQLVTKGKLILFPSLLILGAIISTIDFNISGQQIDMRLLHLNNYFLFYLEAFAGIFTWISFSMILNKNSLLENLGRNSLILFSWHLVIFDYLSIILRFFLNTKIINDIKFTLPLTYTLISISFILFINNIYNKLKLALLSSKLLPQPKSE